MSKLLLWERRSHSISYVGTHGNAIALIIAIKLAIFHCYQETVITFRAPQTMSKLDIRIRKVLAH